MPTDIDDRLSASRAKVTGKVTSKGIKRSREDENQQIKIPTEEAVGKTENTKMI